MVEQSDRNYQKIIIIIKHIKIGFICLISHLFHVNYFT
jgi:hypothetical protein